MSDIYSTFLSAFSHAVACYRYHCVRSRSFSSGSFLNPLKPTPALLWIGFQKELFQRIWEDHCFLSPLASPKSYL